ncbi:asparagine synthetase B (glutamine-hydrolyzing) [Cytobacillus eiseniae]|uniref:Asparagine synthetase B (Glutamine-hydrolyzing) n=1 Tax=Cytobacillus eiseniae TaxID=762947 RepID=A0ABS4RA79_9BACI|nr:hypothetical protein [Cytobacillus eiseniae]MBP2239803.1 asparagine synthetase B (glutamine-hydrolyzing) [Cytobacillus eiseniae]
MLKTNISKYFAEEVSESYKEEIDYAIKHGIIENNHSISLLNPGNRFMNAYIERSDKETEEFLAEEQAAFLNQPINYLKQHINEFIYMESDWFHMIQIESICLEVDDVFGTYEAILGLKLQKKYESVIKTFLENELVGERKVSLMFNQTDGLWDFNFALNNIEGFTDELTLAETMTLVYQFLFKLIESVEA